MNKDLKGNIYRIEPLVLSGIRNALSMYPNSEGTERARELLKGTVNYNQLKRILHDMKNFTKNNDTIKYELCGGKSFESWGTTILNNDRDVVYDNKKSRQNADSIGGTQGRRNGFNKKHRKSQNFSPPKSSLKSNSETYTSSLKLGKLFEEIMKLNI